MSDQEKPLVTFALFAYNQEKYIREAVEGALSQDYENLEIILSDDCSTDGTSNIIEELASAYSGPHVLRSNRNEKNLGLAEHINRVMSLASGELIVVAAGDDISFPSRVSTLVSCWLETRKSVDFLCSDYMAIEKNSRQVGQGSGCKPQNLILERMAAHGYGVLGATAAWTSRLWESFDPLPASLVHEDQVMPFRANLKRGIKYVNLPLVKYRQEVSTWVNRFSTDDPAEMRSRTTKLLYNSIVTACTQMADAAAEKRVDLVSAINRRLIENSILYQLYNNNGVGAVSAFIMSLRHGLNLSRIIKAIIQTRFPSVHKIILRRRNAVRSS